jgi:hypothetical protein
VIEVQIFRKPRSIGKISALTLAMIAAIGLGTTVNATSASAATDVIINQTAATQACRYTYTGPSGTTVFATWPAGATTWECGAYIYLPYPYGIWWLYKDLGPANLQNYCSINYPGSTAVRVSPDMNGWHCMQY